MKLSRCGIAMRIEDRELFYVVHDFEFLNADNSLTFGTPKDVNAEIRKKRPDDAHLLPPKPKPPNPVEEDIVMFFDHDSQLLDFTDEMRDECDHTDGFTPPTSDGKTIDAVLSQPWTNTQNAFDMNEHESSEEAALALDSTINSDVVVSLQEPRKSTSRQSFAPQTQDLNDDENSENLLTTLSNPTLAGVQQSSQPATITESLEQLLKPSQSPPHSPRITEELEMEAASPELDSEEVLSPIHTKNYHMDLGLQTQDISQFHNESLTEDEMFAMLNNQDSMFSKTPKKTQEEVYVGSPELFRDEDDVDDEEEIEDEQNVQDEEMEEPVLEQEEPVVEKPVEEQPTQKKRKIVVEYDSEGEEESKERYAKKQKIAAPKSAKPKVDYVSWLRFL